MGLIIAVGWRDIIGREGVLRARAFFEYHTDNSSELLVSRHLCVAGLCTKRIRFCRRDIELDEARYAVVEVELEIETINTDVLSENAWHICLW
jgi:hypothetical protein